AKMPATGMTNDERATQVAYWRARLFEKIDRKDDATAGYRALAHDRPLSFYGLLAAARLRDTKNDVAKSENPKIDLPTKELPAAAPANAERDPALARVLELLDADMKSEAADELRRGEKDILKRAGGDKAMPWLLGLYRRAQDFHRAYQLA